MTHEKIRIAPAEWEILEVLWENSPLAASEIFDRLTKETDWNVKTIRAFLDRLVKKSAISKHKIHGVFVFEPLVDRRRCLRHESRSFLERCFRGNPISMISHFIEEDEFSQEDITRLLKLLENAKDNDTEIQE